MDNNDNNDDVKDDSPGPVDPVAMMAMATVMARKGADVASPPSAAQQAAMPPSLEVIVAVLACNLELIRIVERVCVAPWLRLGRDAAGGRRYR